MKFFKFFKKIKVPIELKLQVQVTPFSKIHYEVQYRLHDSQPWGSIYSAVMANRIDSCRCDQPQLYSDFEDAVYFARNYWNTIEKIESFMSEEVKKYDAHIEELKREDALRNKTCRVI